MQKLYVHRKVTNWRDIAAWAAAQGFKTTLGEDMHVTVAFSREPFEVEKLTRLTEGHEVPEELGGRSVKPLGDQGAVVLRFDSPALEDRWSEIIDAGASWDFPTYQPHITISYSPGELDLENVQPYGGKIALGPEVFEDLNEDWVDEIKETPVQKFAKSSEILKVDKKLGLVFGFAAVCKLDGKPYVDSQEDHIPEDAMVTALLEFSKNAIAKDMHGQTGNHEQIGTYPFLFPLTTEIAKALGIETRKTGAIVGFHTDDKKILEKYESGEYTGFSIGGNVVEFEMVDAE